MRGLAVSYVDGGESKGTMEERMLVCKGEGTWSNFLCNMQEFSVCFYERCQLSQRAGVFPLLLFSCGVWLNSWSFRG